MGRSSVPFGTLLVLGLLVVWPVCWSAAATLTLSWSQPDPSDVILVERGPAQSGPFAQIGQTASGAISWVDETVNAGSAYCYKVRARNGVGVSGYSNVACASAAASPPAPPPAPIAFVQGAYATPGAWRTTVTVKFPANQTAGNLNVIIVGWNDTRASVSSVTDSRGNAYQRAVGPTRSGQTLSQSIYYAKSVAGGASTVTVRFSRSAASVDVRVLEYSGLDTAAPLLANAIGAGSGTSSSTGNLTTSVAKALLVAGNVVTSGTASAGSGYTSRMITVPDGDIAQDRIAAAGQYAASARLTRSGAWVMQVVAFKGR